MSHFKTIKTWPNSLHDSNSALERHHTTTQSWPISTVRMDGEHSTVSASYEIPQHPPRARVSRESGPSAYLVFGDSPSHMVTASQPA